MPEASVFPEKAFELKIVDLAHDGRGLGFLPAVDGYDRGLAVFVHGALPGETILCQPVKMSRNYLDAAKLKTLVCDFEPDTQLCPHHEECGGCTLLPFPYKQQHYWKEKLLLDALVRLGKLDENTVRSVWQGIVPSPERFHYRNKFVLAFGRNSAGESVLGFRQRRSHYVADAQGCLLLPHELQQIAARCQELAGQGGQANYDGNGFWRFLTLRQMCTLESSEPVWHGLLLTSPGNNQQRVIVRRIVAQILEEFPFIGSLCHAERGKRDFLAAPERKVFTLRKAWPGGTLAMECCGKLFETDFNSFFQTNRGAASILGEKVKEIGAITSGPLLDLYCGVGFPGQLLAQTHAECLGIELNGISIAHARANAARQRLAGFRYLAGDAQKILAARQNLANFHDCTVLADPPRSGIAKAALEKVMRICPGHFIYISCNPVTLARDSALLKDNYSLKQLWAVDMFPQTEHVESLSLWERKPGQRKNCRSEAVFTGL